MAKKLASVPSFTYEDTSDKNIKRFVDRNGDWTHYYLVKEKKFVKAVNHILHLGFNKGPRFAQYLLSVTKEEAQKKLVTAGDEGTRTHRAISDLISGSKVTMATKYPTDLKGGKQEPLNDQEWENLQAFENWCEKYKPMLVAQDQTVSDYETFAGTFDALLAIFVLEGDKCFPKEAWGRQVLILIDWKSSSGIWEEYKAQLSAYWYGIYESHKWDAYIKAFPLQCFSGVVRLGTRHKSGFEFQVWNSMQTAANYALFESARIIANDHEAEWDAEPEIEHMKTEFALEVPPLAVKVVKPKKGSKKVNNVKADKIVVDEAEQLPLKDKQEY